MRPFLSRKAIFFWVLGAPYRVCRRAERQAVMLCACMQYGWQMRGTRERARVACMSMCECVDFCHLTLEPLYD